MLELLTSCAEWFEGAILGYTHNFQLKVPGGPAGACHFGPLPRSQMLCNDLPNLGREAAVTTILLPGSTLFRDQQSIQKYMRE